MHAMDRKRDVSLFTNRDLPSLPEFPGVFRNQDPFPGLPEVFKNLPEFWNYFSKKNSQTFWVSH